MFPLTLSSLRPQFQQAESPEEAVMQLYSPVKQNDCKPFRLEWPSVVRLLAYYGGDGLAVLVPKEGSPSAEALRERACGLVGSLRKLQYQHLPAYARQAGGLIPYYFVFNQQPMLERSLPSKERNKPRDKQASYRQMLADLGELCGTYGYRCVRAMEPGGVHVWSSCAAGGGADGVAGVPSELSLGILPGTDWHFNPLPRVLIERYWRYCLSEAFIDIDGSK